MDEDERVKRIDREFDKHRIRVKDNEALKVYAEVFDEFTLKTLYKLARDDVIAAMGGPISTGKEANVFHALGPNDEELAVKIYRIATSDFKRMSNYLHGDPRFRGIRNSKRDIVFAWTKKEYRNLARAEEAGVRVPSPIRSINNILVMEFIGLDEMSAPRLHDVRDFTPEDHLENYYKIREYMRLLHREAELVHGDLSEFNILYYDGPVIIDMGQSVTLDHPRASDFLQRDVRNISKYFQRQNIGEATEDRLMSYIMEE